VINYKIKEWVWIINDWGAGIEYQRAKWVQRNDRHGTFC
jgi:hypothetical protein